MPEEETDNRIELVGGGVVEPEWDPRGAERRAFQQFAALTRTKRDLERQLDQVKDQLDALAYQLRDYLGEGGYDRVRIDGFTIYVRRQLFARKFDWASTGEVCRALKENDLGQFVKEQYNSQTLSKYIRELEELHEEDLRTGKILSVGELLPKSLVRVLNIEPSFQVVALESQ
jgi:hypothetical protein